MPQTCHKLCNHTVTIFWKTLLSVILFNPCYPPFHFTSGICSEGMTHSETSNSLVIMSYCY